MAEKFPPNDAPKCPTLPSPSFRAYSASPRITSSACPSSGIAVSPVPGWSKAGGHSGAHGEPNPPRVDVHLPGVHSAAGDQYRPGRAVAVGRVQVNGHLDGAVAVGHRDDAPFEGHREILGRQLELLELVLHGPHPRL